MQCKQQFAVFEDWNKHRLITGHHMFVVKEPVHN
jgi:hypothetical protein